MTCHRISLVSLLLLALLAGLAYAAGTRTLSGEGQALTQDAAVHAAVVAALKEGAREISGRVHKVDEVEQWLQQADDFILGQRVGSCKKRGAMFTALVDVDVDPDEFRGIILATKTTDTTGGKSLVMVMIDEQIIRLPAPDPAAETAVKQAFLVDGYEVQSKQITDTNREREIIRSFERGDEAAARALRDEYACDMIVYGEAFAEEVRGGGQFAPFRFTGTCEIHVVMADTGRELATATGTGVAEGETAIQAGKVALKNAGAKAAATALAMLRRGTPVQVVLNKVAYFGTATSITDELKRLVGPDSVKRPRLDLQNQTVTWDITCKDVTAYDIAAALEQLPRPRIQILEVTGQKIVAQVTG
ncbi:MAG: hypothetical protein ABFE08_18370 [Armatimonadia bacterium]